MRIIVLRPRAEDDLGDIWTYTVDMHGEAQAETYLRGLDGAFRLLAEFPEIARMRREFVPPVQIHPYCRRLIVYRDEGTTIEVVRVLHVRANWSSILAE